MNFDTVNIKNLENKPFIIAEIGCNHQGSLDMAKKMISNAKNAGADAVKFQKRNNKELFSKNLYNQIYDNRNSFGKTYGEHREFLEFDKNQYIELMKYANKKDILFLVTPFDISSVDFLEEINVQAYKIASGDLSNIPLQKRILETKKTVFLSTGGGNIEDIKRSYNLFTQHKINFIIMHCTSSYPTAISDMNLNIITTLKREFRNILIGLSDHENGIDAGPIAYMLGARVFEKHFTLNRGFKGTDQAFSLEPDGLRKFSRNLKRIHEMLGSFDKKLLESEKKPLFKLTKSVVASRNLQKGHIILTKDLVCKSPGGGLPPYQIESLIGKKLNTNISKDEMILKTQIEI